MNEYALIPRPASIRYETGVFQWNGLPCLCPIAPDAVFYREARVFARQIGLADSQIFAPQGAVQLIGAEDSAAGEESYRLEILSGTIKVIAPAAAGMYRGLQTLRQLILSGYDDGTLLIPCGVIEDAPRFPWRGFMLDCSRYFYSVEWIKHTLDALSLQHINVLHWHLTDDQGWRLPVDSYPLLVKIGSRRLDRRSYSRYTGGYYTKAVIQDIVEYAAERHIMVVPEVDFPGHASAILAAYPGLGCTGGPYQVEDRFGIFDDVLCAGNDAIFPLAEAVFDTLEQLFPAPYVHIGGDEVRFVRWAECPECRARLAELGLANPAQLQSWITVRLVEMLRHRGKTAIGWDEVLEDTTQFPLPQEMIVMSWRGQEGGAAAAARGHSVIMTPLTNGCYLDYRHRDSLEEPGQLGIATITQSYDMDPLTPEMSGAPDTAGRILGGQGNLWSEIISAGRIAEYMIFPRICAIAESLWSNPNGKDIDDFCRRLVIHQNRLDQLGVLQYRGPVD